MRRKFFPLVSYLALILTLDSCTGQSPVIKRPSPPDAGLQTIEVGELAHHIQTLASDEFEGRLPASKGEELAINYLAGQFKQLGLEPGNPDGTYFQKVPLVSITADPDMRLKVLANHKTLSLKYGDEFMAWTKRVVEETSIEDSDLLFVGYGVVAPEFSWDDYKNEDVKGKTLIMLVNDPPVPDPTDPSKLDDKVFGGKAMTYYGRWTYKYEIAAEKGALGCFIIHETGPAGYPWDVVRGSWSGEQFDLATPDKNMARSAVEGWLTYDAAQRVFQLAGQDLEALKRAALSREFKPVPLRARGSLFIKNKLRTVDSNNVIARLEGSGPALKTQYVVYTAHWDHMGKDPSLAGDQIYNGAVDNATGTAGLLALAKAFASLETPPRRSILFLAVTAEEQGLLGSRYYAEHPIYPLAQTVAEINMDAMNVLGRTEDITIIGLGNSTLDEVTERAAKEQGRSIRPDPQPEKGFFYRSDHFSFAKQGVPALYIDPGITYRGRPAGWGLQMQEKYTEENYHKPSDEFDPAWDLSGLAEDIQVLFRVGYDVANQDQYPEWKPGTEFRARRQKMLEQAGVKP